MRAKVLGRKRRGDRPRLRHAARAPLASRFPVHVTLRLQKGLPSLRRAREHAALREAFEQGADRVGFRLVHYSIQSNHLHLLAEAGDRHALSRGLQACACASRAA